ncbi:MAG: MmcQ/YjbR family DNA-binding protein [Roseobacter sp.]
MTRKDFDQICAGQPGAVLSQPGELDAWKVGGKMFACFGHSDKRALNTEHVAVKCTDADTATMLIDAGAARKAPYFHKSWVQLDLPSLDTDEAQHRVAVSYDTIHRGLPKSIREAL